MRYIIREEKFNLALELREILGYDFKNAVKYKARISDNTKSGAEKNLKEKFNMNEFLKEEDSDFTVKIEAMHCAPFSTGNFTRYMPEACEKSLKEWIEPYNKPTILYHNDYDGIVTGRILKAEMGFSERSNSKCLILTANSPLYDYRQQLREGILLTTSIGVTGTDVRCSICGKQLSDEDMCEHRKGYVYNGKTCYWDVYEFIPKELSYVITPSDIYARVVSINDIYSDYPISTNDNCDGKADTRAQYRLTNTESQKQEPEHGLKITESKNDKSSGENINKETTDNTMDEKKYQETLAMNESLTVENKTLVNDKEDLKQQIDKLNKEKLAMQESMADIKKQLEDKTTEVDSIKQMKEQAENENKKLLDEVKGALVDKLASMRKDAGRPAIDKLEERDLSYLRYAISDLEAEMAAIKMKESQQNVDDPTLHEPDIQNKNQSQDGIKINESEDKKTVAGLSLGF